MEDGGGMSCAATNTTADALKPKDYVRLLGAVKC
jgi:hypothetical protein